jgi:YD repeat-containing protein
MFRATAFGSKKTEKNMKVGIWLIFSLLVASDLMAGSVRYVYDAAGRLTGVHYEGVSRTSYILDPMGNMLCAGDGCVIHVETESARAARTAENCAGKNPCFSSVGRGIDASGAGANLKLTFEFPFDEHISVVRDTRLLIEGGWNSDFSEKNGSTTIRGSFTIADGVVVVDGIVIGSQDP